MDIFIIERHREIWIRARQLQLMTEISQWPQMIWKKYVIWEEGHMVIIETVLIYLIFG